MIYKNIGGECFECFKVTSVQRAYTCVTEQCDMCDSWSWPHTDTLAAAPHRKMPKIQTALT